MTVVCFPLGCAAAPIHIAVRCCLASNTAVLPCVQVKWFSPFLLAAYDPDTETFQSLCRCMSGFTDEFYAAATARLGATAIPGPKPYYDTHERPDVWFEPTEVRRGSTWPCWQCTATGRLFGSVPSCAARKRRTSGAAS
eukprot:GHRQ01029152.1.p2 GENE.GHRQ01029152.1~~GHRQ01029152.1.p2  ORF type:complete len:139 (+),score=25.22 GHRQ01029152.1:702-1118(+)